MCFKGTVVSSLHKGGGETSGLQYATSPPDATKSYTPVLQEKNSCFSILVIKVLIRKDFYVDIFEVFSIYDAPISEHILSLCIRGKKTPWQHNLLHVLACWENITQKG